jgi:hypothetical protein
MNVNLRPQNCDPKTATPKLRPQNATPKTPRQKRPSKKDFLRGQMGGVIGEHKVPLSFSAFIFQLIF